MTRERLVPVRRKVAGQSPEIRQEGEGKSEKGMKLKPTALELQSGMPLLMQQTKALGKKNMLVVARKKMALFQLFLVSFLIIFLMFAMEKISNAITNASEEFRDDPEPSYNLLSQPLPPCEEFSMTRPCYDFVWTGGLESTPRIQRIVDGIMANNPGRPIPPSKPRLGLDGKVIPVMGHHITCEKGGLMSPWLTLGFSTDEVKLIRIVEMVKSFKTENETNAWFLSNPARTPGALHLADKNDTVISYGIQPNSSAQYIVPYEQPFLKFQLPLQTAAEREIARILLKDEYCLLGIYFSQPVTLSKPGYDILAAPFKDKMAMKIIKNILPVIPFGSAIEMLVNSISDDNHGMRWKERNNCPTVQGEAQDCEFTMDGIYLRLIGCFFLWLIVALYLDNILPSENGIPKSPFYFLNPGYWTGQGGCGALESGIFGCTKWLPKPETTTPDDEDVLEEENKIKKMMDDGVVDPDVAVQIRGLIKTYPGKLTKTLRRLPPFHSVKGLWVNFPKDQLFCLLGHNGAGKTTTISCLTGITPVSGGDGDTASFDILWDVLSGEEHLELFSSIKGLPPDSIPTNILRGIVKIDKMKESCGRKKRGEEPASWDAEKGTEMIVHQLLEDVQLGKSAKIRSGSYSGGMRRRLSVAAALIGDPKLVILDEPTTGMDPLTRRHVWDIIESSKRGRAIVLTTHSMEEADVLSDRIGIMAKGKLRCIGTPIRLKMRFGTGFVAHMNFDNNNAGETENRSREELKQLFKKQLDIEPMEENKAYTTYVIPHEKEPLLKKTFGEVQDRKNEFGITDIQLGLATLEEVFLNIAKQEEMEIAAAEGKNVTLSLTSGTSIQIPIGARFIGIPGTESAENPHGTMVEVYWGQDESGNPEILGHSPEKPIPPSLNLALPKSTTKEVQGIVIDPSQVSDESFS
ncbi:ABC transporter A family member 2 [Bienertia sinuspersici]